jgi:hypothetical protein
MFKRGLNAKNHFKKMEKTKDEKRRKTARLLPMARRRLLEKL